MTTIFGAALAGALLLAAQPGLALAAKIPQDSITVIPGPPDHVCGSSQVATSVVDPVGLAGAGILALQRSGQNPANALPLAFNMVFDQAYIVDVVQVFNDAGVPSEGMGACLVELFNGATSLGSFGNGGQGCTQRQVFSFGAVEVTTSLLNVHSIANLFLL